MDKKNKHYFVSIIIPTYNVEAYIRECLESVAAQTYEGNIECIIVDDCGTDNSIAVAEQFITEYKGCIDFRILHREKNGGLSAARNSGTDAATGDYIFYLDSDDYITADCIETFVTSAKLYPNSEIFQAGILDTNNNHVYDASKLERTQSFKNGRDIQKQLLYLSAVPVSSCNRLIKRDFIIKNNIRFIEGIIHEDVPYHYQLINYFQYFTICNSNTYVYRIQREGSIINTTNEEKSIRHRLIGYQYCLRNNCISHNVVYRSLFLRYLLAKNSTLSNELKKELNSFAKNLISRASFLDSVIMLLFYCLSETFKNNNKVYNCYRHIVS